MAGTIEGLTLCLMMIVAMLFSAVRTGESIFWLMVCIGIIAAGAHIAIMKQNKDTK